MTRLSRLSWALDRRAVLTGASLVAAAGFWATLPFPGAEAAGPAEVSVEELMKPAELPDIKLGPDTAKVTIVEYASLGCSHCKHFHDTAYPELKKKYIDTGKVRFIYRDFPLNMISFAASMLARCAGGDKTLPLIDVFFDKQADWAVQSSNPQAKLFEIAKQAGFTQESFEKCLTDQKLTDQMTAVQTRASQVFGVNATPTFFINGKRLQAAPVIEEFDKVLEPLLKE